MRNPTIVDKSKFTLRYAGEVIKVQTPDYIPFAISFANGSKKILTFEIEASSAAATEIGKSIETICLT